jgi:hypothetical protein
MQLRVISAVATFLPYDTDVKHSHITAVGFYSYPVQSMANARNLGLQHKRHDQMSRASAAGTSEWVLSNSDAELIFSTTLSTVADTNAVDLGVISVKVTFQRRGVANF